MRRPKTSGISGRPEGPPDEVDSDQRARGTIYEWWHEDMPKGIEVGLLNEGDDDLPEGIEDGPSDEDDEDDEDYY